MFEANTETEVGMRPERDRERESRKMAANAPKKALIILAPGAEEMETVISTDVLRRANIAVTLAGLDGKEPVTCSRQVVLVPDTSLDDAMSCGPYDVILLPGGLGGAKRLGESEKVKKVLAEQEAKGSLIAAVCAAPTSLVAHGVAKGKQLTSYPSLKQRIVDGGHAYSEARVCKDGTVITSRGPGTCFEFALAVVEALVGSQVAKEIGDAMLIK